MRSNHKHPREYLLPLFGLIFFIVALWYGFTESHDNIDVKINPMYTIQVQDSCTIKCVRCGYTNTVYIYKKALILDPNERPDQNRGK